jgi:predicted nicotinamide N-methyase
MEKDTMLLSYDGKYDVKTSKYNLGTEWISITMVNDTNRLLDEMSVEDHLLETNFPFWAELWPSALALARYIWDNVDFHGEQVLELGCGLGLVGIVARKKQAKVLMTDYNDDALMFAKYNAIKNKCEDIQFRSMDWQHPNLDNQKFKYILASDIIYEEQNWIPIVNIFDAVSRKASVNSISPAKRQALVYSLQRLMWVGQCSMRLLKFRGEEK